MRLVRGPRIRRRPVPVAPAGGVHTASPVARRLPHLLHSVLRGVHPARHLGNARADGRTRGAAAAGPCACPRLRTHPLWQPAAKLRHGARRRPGTPAPARSGGAAGRGARSLASRAATSVTAPHPRRAPRSGIRGDNTRMEVSFASAVVILVLVADPLGNIPVFVVLLRNVEPARRVRVIVRECVIASAVLVAFMLFGSDILSLLGLSDRSLNIAGGVILLLIALRMVFREDENIFVGLPAGEPLTP